MLFVPFRPCLVFAQNQSWYRPFQQVQHLAFLCVISPPCSEVAFAASLHEAQIGDSRRAFARVSQCAIGSQRYMVHSALLGSQVAAWSLLRLHYFPIILRLDVSFRQYGLKRSWTALAMLDPSVSSNSLQSEPTICWSASVTNVQSFCMATWLFFFSLPTSVSKDVEKDDVAFSAISAFCPCILFAALLKFSVRDLLFWLFPAPMFALLVRCYFSCSVCLIASRACSFDAISRASVCGRPLAVVGFPDGSPHAWLPRVSRLLTTFTSPSILAAWESSMPSISSLTSLGRCKAGIAISSSLFRISVVFAGATSTIFAGSATTSCPSRPGHLFVIATQPAFKLMETTRRNIREKTREREANDEPTKTHTHSLSLFSFFSTVL